jgi:5,10-methylenetetrahydromethanopterin reductase
MTEFGVVHMPMPGVGAEIARRAEDMGFDICLFTDTPRLAGDPFAEACLAAQATSTIRLGTGMTNPVTRSAAAISSAIGTVHIESSGRAVLGISRGDSAAAHAGMAPATVANMTASIRELRDWLTRRLTWLEAAGLPSIPIDVACSGPRSIAAAAAIADRVSLAVGASPDRVRWALDIARKSVAASGRPPGAVRFGVYLSIVVDDDVKVARELARAGVGVLAHFSAMTASPQMVPEAHAHVFEQLRHGYEMDRHTWQDSFQARVVTDEFIDWFAITGSADRCRLRLEELIGLGLDHVYVIGGATTQSPLDVLEGEARFAKEVIPSLRRWPVGAATTRTHIEEES